MSSHAWSSTFFDFLRFRASVPLSDWADQNRIIPSGSGAEPGRWRTSRTPYLKKILDAVTDSRVRQVVVCTGIQLGKTEVLLNACAYHIQHDPAPVLFVEPSDDLATDIGETRIDPMIQYMPGLRPLFGLKDGKNRSTKTGQIKQTLKRYPGGFIKLASAASESDLVSRSIRVVLCDEVDKYTPLADGSPVDRAKGRTSNFVNYKLVLTSSPSTLKNSEIWRRLGETARYEYRVPCPCCGVPFVWLWQHVRWDKNAAGESDAGTARIECPFCGGVVRGAGSASDVLLARGDWCLVSGDPSSSSVGFQMNSLLSPWVSLADIVGEFLAACHNRDVDRLKTFVTDRLAEPWDERPAPWHSESLTSGESRFDRYDDHSKVVCITAGVDVQRDRIECSFYGWGKNRESWVVEHFVLGDVDTTLAPCWDDFRQKLLSPVELSDGRKMRISAACVDSGDGVLTQMVYRFTGPLESRHVVSIKGRGGENVPMFAPPTRRNPQKAALYVLGVDKIKDVVVDRLDLTTRGPGFIHVPEHLSGKFWQQLNAERKEEVVERGRTSYVWKKIHERNEALDCCVYALAAFELFCVGHSRRPAVAVHTRRRLS